MIREIVKPEGNTYLLQLPDEMVGKTVEVNAFEIEENKPNLSQENAEQLREEVDEVLSKYNRHPKIIHEGFKFDRDEANNYE
jgi:hypothetical protein